MIQKLLLNRYSAQFLDIVKTILFVCILSNLQLRVNLQLYKKIFHIYIYIYIYTRCVSLERQ